MAIILGSKNVKDLPENESVAIGILLPITNGNNGYFAQSFNTIDAIKTDIKNLLLTKQGERLMQPSFGTRLWNILFENDTTDNKIESDIEEEIETALSNWLPFVKVSEILINKDNPTNRDKNIYNVSILFRTQEFQNLESVTFNIEE